jgi:uncharacterized metal-binding protein
MISLKSRLTENNRIQAAEIGFLGSVTGLKLRSEEMNENIMHIDGCLLGCSALVMEAAMSSETLVNFYQTTRRYNPEDSHLRTHRRENLKS